MNENVIVGTLTHSAYGYGVNAIVVMSEEMYKSDIKLAIGLIKEEGDDMVGFFIGNQVKIALTNVKVVEDLDPLMLNTFVKLMSHKKLVDVTFGDLDITF